MANDPDTAVSGSLAIKYPTNVPIEDSSSTVPEFDPEVGNKTVPDTVVGELYRVPFVPLTPVLFVAVPLSN